MDKNLYIDASHPDETRIVLKSNISIEEYEYEDKNRLNFKNNIYLGTISRVEPSLQAAFVDFGRLKHGFLAFNDIQSDYYQIPSADTLIDNIIEQTITINVIDSSGNVETCDFNLSVKNNDVNNCYRVYVPNVFSPDGDGHNDVFLAYGIELKDLEIEIYNRWGQMVFKDELLNSNGWNGTFNGKDCPSGTYVYKIKDIAFNIRQSGTVSLVR